MIKINSTRVVPKKGKRISISNTHIEVSIPKGLAKKIEEIMK